MVGLAVTGGGPARHAFPLGEQLQRRARIGFVDQVARTGINARQLLSDAGEQHAEIALRVARPSKALRKQSAELGGIGGSVEHQPLHVTVPRRPRLPAAATTSATGETRT